LTCGLFARAALISDEKGIRPPVVGKERAQSMNEELLVVNGVSLGV
jgi:hypothetical protein